MADQPDAQTTPPEAEPASEPSQPNPEEEQKEVQQ